MANVDHSFPHLYRLTVKIKTLLYNQNVQRVAKIRNKNPPQQNVGLFSPCAGWRGRGWRGGAGQCAAVWAGLGWAGLGHVPADSGYKAELGTSSITSKPAPSRACNEGFFKL